MLLPHDESIVPWHQDARYWPLEPRATVTVWLAVFDTDHENGCMRIIPGSHRWGNVRHEAIPDSPNWDKMSPDEARNNKYVLSDSTPRRHDRFNRRSQRGDD